MATMLFALGFIYYQHRTTINTNAKIDALQAELNKTDEKLLLLATILNDNIAEQKNPLYINEDWTIDRLPTHLDLNGDDMTWIKKYAK